jgi:transposase InsO family protein
MKAAARPSGADSGHRVQIDVKFVESLTISTAGTTAGSSAGAAAGEMRSGWRARTPVHRDRRLHRLRVLRIYPQCNQKSPCSSSITSLGRLPSRSRLSRLTTVSNSSQLFIGMSWTRTSVTSTSNPVHPTQRQSRTLQRIDAEEFYGLFDGVVIDDAMVFNDKLKAWEDYCNYHRPHGTLGGQTPNERLRQKPTQVSPIYHSRTR